MAISDAGSTSDSGSESDHAAADGRITVEEDKDPDSSTDDELPEDIKRMAESRFAQIPLPPPAAYEIPQEVYTKAWKQQDQLTDEERQLLLSRGDLVGKALAHPELLTPEECNVVLSRPPPDVVRAAIERATGGTLHTPEELYAKAREILQNGGTGTLNDEEVGLMALNFPADVYDAVFNSAPRNLRQIPGNDEAYNLLAHRQSGFTETSTFILSRWSIGTHQRIRNRAILAGHGVPPPTTTAAPLLPGSLPGPWLSGPVSQVARLGLGLPGTAPPPPPPPMAQGQGLVSDGGGELDAIVDELEQLQTKREKGELTDQIFMEQTRKQIASLRTYSSRKKSPRFHPYHLPLHAQAPPLGMPPQQDPSTYAAFSAFLTGQNIPGFGFGGNVGTGTASYTMPGAPFSALHPPQIANVAAQMPLSIPPFIPASPGGVAPLPPGPERAHPGRWSRTVAGQLRWPPLANMQFKTPIACFSDDLKEKMKAEGIVVEDYMTYLRENFILLPPQKQAAYSAMAEAARIEAWDQYDRERLENEAPA